MALNVRFQVPSCRNYYLEMSQTSVGYQFELFRSGHRIKSFQVTEADFTRENLRKTAANSGIEFYALSGPYDMADEILRQWKKHFQKKGFLQRLLRK
ncbi:MAG: hypothetical protein ACFFFG_01720 [Candidatus Thorarchaeota archaeon]